MSASRDYSQTEPVIAKLHHISFMFTKRIQQPHNLWLILDIQLCYMCSDPPERPLSIRHHSFPPVQLEEGFAWFLSVRSQSYIGEQD